MTPSKSINIDNVISTKFLLSIIATSIAISIFSALSLTLINAREYWQTYDFCLNIGCIEEAGNAFSVQFKLLKFGMSAATFFTIIFGSYLALKSYITSSEIGAFGNRISHIGVFERFITLELSRRPKLNPGNIDVYALYQLMFPPNNANSHEASKNFTECVKRVLSIVKKSSDKYTEDPHFHFGSHRIDFINALTPIHITMDELPRIDFLEVEDEVIDFLLMLTLVFAPSNTEICRPIRKYR